MYFMDLAHSPIDIHSHFNHGAHFDCPEDVSHLRSLNFVESVYQKAARYGREGIYCGIIHIMDYSRFRLCQASPSVTLGEFVQRILSFAKVIKAKSNTIAWVKSNATEPSVFNR